MWVSRLTSLSAQNCHDFWTNGGALGVDYTALYEIPENGQCRLLRTWVLLPEINPFILQAFCIDGKE